MEGLSGKSQRKISEKDLSERSQRRVSVVGLSGRSQSKVSVEARARSQSKVSVEGRRSKKVAERRSGSGRSRSDAVVVEGRGARSQKRVAETGRAGSHRTSAENAQNQAPQGPGPRTGSWGAVDIVDVWICGCGYCREFLGFGWDRACSCPVPSTPWARAAPSARGVRDRPGGSIPRPPRGLPPEGRALAAQGIP